MNLDALKDWYDWAVEEKGSALWRVYPSSVSKKPLATNLKQTDTELSFDLLKMYLVGQSGEGVKKFYVKVFANERDSAPAEWMISNSQSIQGAAIGGANRMSAQPTVNAAQSAEMKELRELVKELTVQSEKQQHQFELYQKDIAHARELDAERAKTAAALGQAEAAKNDNKSGLEKFIDHPAVAPKLGMAVGKAISAVFPEPQQLAVAGADRGATVPRVQETAEVIENTADEEEDDGLNLSEDERLVLDLYDIMIERGITDAAERIYFTGMYGLQDWTAMKPMQDGIIAEMKAKKAQ